MDALAAGGNHVIGIARTQLMPWVDVVGIVIPPDVFD